MASLGNIVHAERDPKVLATGPGSLDSGDRLARGLAWFSIGLGVVELFAAHRLSRALGMPDKAGLLRAFGAREIGSGILSMSLEKRAGLWSRVAGDGVDIATLGAALRPGNPKRGNVALALTAVLGITVLDVVGAQAIAVRRRRTPSRDYSDRTGFPRGIEAARGIAAVQRASTQVTP